jgi:formiminoglutamase
MDFSLLFDQVQLDYDWKQKLPVDACYHSIYVNEETFPDLEKMDIALFSIDDNRGTQNQVLDAIKVREQFYRLKKSNAHYRIVDLGCLRPGPSYQDSILRYKEICNYLMAKNILPLIINCSQDFVLHTYQMMLDEKISAKINLAIIDSELDIFPKGNLDQTFVNQILEYKIEQLGRFKLLGYQSYLNSAEIKLVFDRLAFEELRLGALKKDIFSAEPTLRNADIISMDLKAIKHHEFPANASFSPYGFSAEEACQLAWFSGLSNNLKCFLFSGYFENEDDTLLSANGMSVFIWYFIEGFYAKVKENLETDVLEYIIENQNFAEPLKFIKSKKSDQWWIYLNNEYIPCLYADYLKASSGELPDVWLREQW